jgi:hypothetical protein
MRFIHLYLVGYFVLLFGAGFALWQAGVVQHVPAAWLGVAVLVAVGLGIVLAMTSTRPPTRT